MPTRSTMPSSSSMAGEFSVKNGWDRMLVAITITSVVVVVRAHARLRSRVGSLQIVRQTFS